MLLDWHDATWNRLVKGARETGLDVNTLLESSGPRIEEHGDLNRLMETAQTHLPAAAGAATRQLKLDHIRLKLNQIHQELAPFDRAARPGDAVRSLRQAFRARNHAQYARAYEELDDLRARLPVFETRKHASGTTGPGRARVGRRRQAASGPHGAVTPPGDPKTAWRWRVLHDELDRRAAVNPSNIQAEIERLDGELQGFTAKLVNRLAWAAQIEGATPEQRRSLIGWMQAMKKVGKGTGKRAPRLLAAAREYMAESRSAVPVWIMP